MASSNIVEVPPSRICVCFCSETTLRSADRQSDVILIHKMLIRVAVDEEREGWKEERSGQKFVGTISKRYRMNRTSGDDKGERSFLFDVTKNSLLSSNQRKRRRIVFRRCRRRHSPSFHTAAYLFPHLYPLATLSKIPQFFSNPTRCIGLLIEQQPTTPRTRYRLFRFSRVSRPLDIPQLQYRPMISKASMSFCAETLVIYRYVIL